MAKTARGLLAILALLLLPGISRAAGGRFDGAWVTTVSCDAIRDALGFSYRFHSEVKESSFRGLHGTEGKPGFLLIEGKIADDGSAELYAKGQTGSKEFVLDATRRGARNTAITLKPNSRRQRALAPVLKAAPAPSNS